MKENGLEKRESREHEVEVRAFIPEAEFETALKKLTDLFGEPTITEMKTFLFRSPDGYGRIRIKKGENKAVLTYKIGDYNEKAREEVNRDIGFDEIEEVLQELKEKGLTECSYLRSTGHAFTGKGEQKLFLSRHEHLGDFLEVEALTDDKSQIEQKHQEVKATLSGLGFQELSAKAYQAMMDEMYAKTLKLVDEYRQEISTF